MVDPFLSLLWLIIQICCFKPYVWYFWIFKNKKVKQPLQNWGTIRLRLPRKLPRKHLPWRALLGVRCCGFSGSTTGLDEASPCDAEIATIHRPGWSRGSRGFVAGEIGQFLGPWPWKNISSLCLDFLMCLSKNGTSTTWRIYIGAWFLFFGGACKSQPTAICKI